MNIISYIYMSVLSLLPQSQPAYSTIVYPTRGEGVVVHDGLGIHKERPWYSMPQTEVVPEQAQQGQFYAADASDDSAASEDVVGATCSSDDSIAAHKPSSLWSSLFAVGAVGAAGGISTFSDHVTGTEIIESPQFLGVNPATGLPMMDSGLDVGGNAFGVDNSFTDVGGSDFGGMSDFGGSSFGGSDF